MATGTLGTFEITTSRHVETTPVENEDLVRTGSSTLDGKHDRTTVPSRQINEERPLTDDAWQTVLTLRQNKQQARQRERGTDLTGSISPGKPHHQRRQTIKLPPFSKEDLKIIIRPHRRLLFKTISKPALTEAIVTACNYDIRGEIFLLRIKPGSISAYSRDRVSTLRNGRTK
ncbi:hypothetical protein MTO96_030210 [Rhipicephalus appendiculatus]